MWFEYLTFVLCLVRRSKQKNKTKNYISIYDIKIEAFKTFHMLIRNLT